MGDRRGRTIPHGSVHHSPGSFARPPLARPIRWKSRLGQAKEDLKTHAQLATEEARATLEAIRNLLAATLSVDDRIDWDSLMETREFQPEPVKLPPERPQPPEGTFWQKLLFPLWRKRLEEFANFIPIV